MDPTECLRLILKKSAEIQALEEKDFYGQDDKMQEAADRIAELGAELAGHIQDLNRWISSGGFLPDQWRPCEECGPEHGKPDGRCVRHGKLLLMTRPRGTPA